MAASVNVRSELSNPDALADPRVRTDAPLSRNATDQSVGPIAQYMPM
jgi:hypothetical protein